MTQREPPSASTQAEDELLKAFDFCTARFAPPRGAVPRAAFFARRQQPRPARSFCALYRVWPLGALRRGSRRSCNGSSPSSRHTGCVFCSLGAASPRALGRAWPLGSMTFTSPVVGAITFLFFQPWSAGLLTTQASCLDRPSSGARTLYFLTHFSRRSARTSAFRGWLATSVRWRTTRVSSALREGSFIVFLHSSRRRRSVGTSSPPQREGHSGAASSGRRPPLFCLRGQSVKLLLLFFQM